MRVGVYMILLYVCVYGFILFVCVCDYTLCVCVSAGGYWRVYVEDVIWALMWTPAACLIHPNVCVCVCVQDGFQGCLSLGWASHIM